MFPLACDNCISYNVPTFMLRMARQSETMAWLQFLIYSMYLLFYRGSHDIPVKCVKKLLVLYTMTVGFSDVHVSKCCCLGWYVTKRIPAGCKYLKVLLWFVECIWLKNVKIQLKDVWRFNIPQGKWTKNIVNVLLQFS